MPLSEEVKLIAARAVVQGRTVPHYGTVLGQVPTPAEWNEIIDLAVRPGQVRTFEPAPYLDDLRMHRSLLEVHAHWTFRLLPKDVREEILTLIGESK
jgi:hypothetical protein